MTCRILVVLICLSLGSCQEEEPDLPTLTLTGVQMGSLDLMGPEQIGDVPTDEVLTLRFSVPLSPDSAEGKLVLNEKDSGNEVRLNMNFLEENRVLRLLPVGLLKKGTTYELHIQSGIKAENGQVYAGQKLIFTTELESISVSSFVIEGAEQLSGERWVGALLDFQAELHFSRNFHLTAEMIRLETPNGEPHPVQVAAVKDSLHFLVFGDVPLQDLRRYTLLVSPDSENSPDGGFEGFEITFYTEAAAEPKFPLLGQNALLDSVQSQTFRYFWDFAHPVSGMIRERSSSGDLVTTGGSGFGIMALMVGMERGYVSRDEGMKRLSKILDFLAQADRYHGVWPHWLNGVTGKTIPFSTLDNGGDLVETALLIQGLLTIRAYLDVSSPNEKGMYEQITRLWEQVEWDWYTRGGQNRLYWHWSPDMEWAMDLPVSGYNEALIVYILAAASPTYPVDAEVYHQGWAGAGQIQNGNVYYGFPLPLGPERGGPLFFAHYSFLGLDPRNLADRYAVYWEQNRNHSLINRAYCVENPLGYVGYGGQCWGLTASDSPGGYEAHSPSRDLGVITPTAALSSMPYTPEESMEALQFFYYKLGDRLWGEMGFRDAFDLSKQWVASDYLAIDQGPILLMIENHRSALLWDHFMQNEVVLQGLEKLDFTYE